MIKQYDLNMIYITGPGHGGPAMVANTYLEGTYSEIYPEHLPGRGGHEEAVQAVLLSRAASPATSRPKPPARSTKAANWAIRWPMPTARRSTIPICMVACVVGDGEAETGPLAASWHSNKFLNPARDGAVLAHPAPQRLQNRQPHRPGSHQPRGIGTTFRGYGYKPYFVEGDDPERSAPAHGGHAGHGHRRDQGDPDRGPRRRASRNGPHWPMIILRTPKGWTGPKEVDGLKTEGSWRSHQVPLSELATKPEHLKLLEEWMKSYKPEELFDANGKLIPELAELAPKGDRRMGANPHANGGLLLKDLNMPDFRDYAVDVPKPGISDRPKPPASWAQFLRDVMKLNAGQPQFPRLRPGRNRIQPAGLASRGHRPRLGQPRFSKTTITSPRTAGSWRS